MRINARIDEQHSERLRFLTRSTNASVSEVLKRAIDLYYEHRRRECGDATAALTASGFVGVADGDPELSTTYKQRLSEELLSKHDHR